MDNRDPDYFFTQELSERKSSSPDLSNMLSTTMSWEGDGRLKPQAVGECVCWIYSPNPVLMLKGMAWEEIQFLSPYFGYISVPGTAALAVPPCIVKEFPQEEQMCQGYVDQRWGPALSLCHFVGMTLPGYFRGERQTGSILHSWCITLQFWSASRHSSYSNCSVACKMTRAASPFPDGDHKRDFNERQAKKG